jgi:hypothetical protein
VGVFDSPFYPLLTATPTGSWIVSSLLGALYWVSSQSVEFEHSNHVCGLGAAVPIFIAVHAGIAVLWFVSIALVLRWMCRSD